MKNNRKPKTEIIELYNKICKSVDWVNSGKYKGYKVCKKEIMKVYNFNDLQKVAKFCCDLRDELGYKVDKFARKNDIKEYFDFGQNDSDSDCLLEIVSMGYQKYLEFYNNPQSVINLYETDEYEESFLYCFPFEEDYE